MNNEETTAAEIAIAAEMTGEPAASHAFALVEALKACGVAITREDLRGLDSRVWEAACAVAFQPSRATLEQEGLLMIIKDAGGLDRCTVDWCAAAVQHALCGDRPADMEPGEYHDDIEGAYNDLQAVRDQFIDGLTRAGNSFEMAEAAFFHYASTPAAER